MLLIRGQPFLSALIVGVVMMLTGLELLYFSNPIFGASEVDYLIAFGWGLGLQIAGTSITQMLGRAGREGPEAVIARRTQNLGIRDLNAGPHVPA